MVINDLTGVRSLVVTELTKT